MLLKNVGSGARSLSCKHSVKSRSRNWMLGEKEEEVHMVGVIERLIVGNDRRRVEKSLPDVGEMLY